MDVTPAGVSSSRLSLQNILLLPKASPLVDLTTPLSRPHSLMLPSHAQGILSPLGFTTYYSFAWHALITPSAILKLSFGTHV